MKLKKSATEDHTKAIPAVGTIAAVEGTGGGVVNNMLHSLFRQCSIYLNGTPVSQSDNNYSFRSMIEVLLNYSGDASTTHLETIGE